MKHRLLRVNELVKRELSGIIAREINFESAIVTINQVSIPMSHPNPAATRTQPDERLGTLEA